MANLATALITHKKIKTTDAKAKELRMFIEPLITFAKRGDLHARRQVLKKIYHKSVVRELFEVVGPTFTNRDGGYTRITKRGFRDNDCAPMSMIEFVDMGSELVPQGETEE
jgi:large subunit ribosomal protein L17